MRPLNLIEKLIARASGRSDIVPGSTAVIPIDWLLASELSWSQMELSYKALGQPDIVRPGRFWLACDHTVDRESLTKPAVKAMVETAERIVKRFPAIDFHEANTTIMHTEFARERVLPGQIVIGSDSHTSSAGTVGALAIGFGATDATMGLVTGQTWLTVPETIRLELVGKPPLGVGGKDVILYILQQLRRNTVALERAVEYGGPGLSHLSIDARFAMSNMTAEFGGLAGVCEPDAITAAYVTRRKDKGFRDGVYLRPDEGATYAGVYTIDLSKVDSLVALYPSPDNVRPVREVQAEGKLDRLDGIFIGACTTGFEDLVLGALVLEAGLAKGLKPVDGRRKVTPGSRPIVNALRSAGLLAVYERAGFEIGAPGCSYCAGLASDKAGSGEVWLSSQNRNFKDRMGKGSIGNLASAATCAASSFTMQLVDPTELLAAVDHKRFRKLCGDSEVALLTEPAFASIDAHAGSARTSRGEELRSPPLIRGGIQRFGDAIDTDLISPSATLARSATATDEELRQMCFEYSRPSFAGDCLAGRNIVVAGTGWACGSSRESAATMLVACGCPAVIAKSFAFIGRRNLIANAIVAAQITADSFFAAVDALGELQARVEVDLGKSVVRIEGDDREWPFALEPIERSLLLEGGMVNAYLKHGRGLYA